MNHARSVVRCLLAGLFLLPAALEAQVPPVHVVLFTHIEDAVPSGALGSAQSRQNYLLFRSRLIDVGNLARDAGLPWSFEPDWKILEAALIYEDAALMATTNGKNFLRYLKEDLGVIIDPHSHENGGYNYTDVAHLLDSLGVGGSTVIGGHIWDPSDPLFQEWDRYRVPVPGERYPWALWRGDILMGSGTPNHVNDPLVSGVWRPQDRDNYFQHDGTANIVAIGAYKGTLETIQELVDLYESGAVSAEYMLTSSYHIKPSMITRPGGIADVADSVITPVVAMRDSGAITPTNFTSLVEAWQTSFGSRGFLYDAEGVLAAGQGGAESPPRAAIVSCSPNPLASGATVRFSVPRAASIRLAVFDVLGREVAVLADGPWTPGLHAAAWDARGAAGGIYFCRLSDRSTAGTGGRSVSSWKLVLTR